jgi:hypothetical protein
MTSIPPTTFRLNARLLEAAGQRWPNRGLVAGAGRHCGSATHRGCDRAPDGMTRQGVQRVAGLLVAHHLAEYRTNPAYRRAKLLACGEAGYWAIRRSASWPTRSATGLEHNWPRTNCGTP